MQDDRRADILARLLDGREKLPDDLPDPDLDELVALGNAIERQAPNLAFMARAESEINPGFAKQLRETLLSEHPGVAHASQPAATPSPQGSRTAKPAGPAARTRMYRAILLPFVAAALIITTVNALLHPSASPRLANGAATSTAARAAVLVAAPQTPKRKTITVPGATPAPRMHVFSSFHVIPSPTYVAGGYSGAGPAPGSRHTTALTQTPVPPQPRALGVEGPPAVPVHMPASLASLPARAVVYGLRYARFSTGDVSRIAASFPALRQTGVSVYRSSNDRETLAVNGSTPTRVTYRQSAGATASAASAEGDRAQAAVQTAKGWLTAHLLIPGGVDLAQAQTSYSASTRTLVFRNRPPAGLSGSTMPAGISVVFDAGGGVSAADVTWPSLSPGRSVPLIDPRQALATASAFSAPPGSSASVDAVTLVYEKAGGSKTPTWQPAYRFAGHIVTPGRPARTVVQIVPAVATGK